MKTRKLHNRRIHKRRKQYGGLVTDGGPVTSGDRYWAESKQREREVEDLLAEREKKREEEEEREREREEEINRYIKEDNISQLDAEILYDSSYKINAYYNEFKKHFPNIDNTLLEYKEKGEKCIKEYNEDTKVIIGYKPLFASQIKKIFNELYDSNKHSEIIKCLLNRNFAKKAIKEIEKKKVIIINKEKTYCYNEIKKVIINFNHNQTDEVLSFSKSEITLTDDLLKNISEITTRRNLETYNKAVNKKYYKSYLNFNEIQSYVSIKLQGDNKDNYINGRTDFLVWKWNYESKISELLSDESKKKLKIVLDFFLFPIENNENRDDDKYVNFQILLETINVLFLYSNDELRTKETCVSGQHGVLRTLKKLVNCMDKKSKRPITYKSNDVDDDENADEIADEIADENADENADESLVEENIRQQKNETPFYTLGAAIENELYDTPPTAIFKEGEEGGRRTKRRRMQNKKRKTKKNKRKSKK
jgi:hypothetical protein